MKIPIQQLSELEPIHVTEVLGKQHAEFDNDEVRSYNMGAIEFYRNQIHNYQREGVDDPSILVSFFNAIDEEIVRLNADPDDSFEPRCQAGCAHCCKIQVHISLEEARLLVLCAREEKIPIDREYLKAQLALTDKSHYSGSVINACVFLDQTTNRCKVYESRPSICRKHQVASTPDWCDYDKNGTKMVAILFNREAELMTSALMNMNQGIGGQMAAMLLRALDETDV